MKIKKINDRNMEEKLIIKYKVFDWLIDWFWLIDN